METLKDYLFAERKRLDRNFMNASSEANQLAIYKMIQKVNARIFALQTSS